MPEAEPKPKVKLSEAFVQLLKGTATFAGAEVRKRFAPVEFLRSLDDFKEGRVVSDDVALNNPPPKSSHFRYAHCWPLSAIARHRIPPLSRRIYGLRSASTENWSPA